MQPFTDDISALLAISWPFLREAVAGHVVAFEAKRVPDNLGGAVAVVAVDCLLKKVRHGYASSLSIRASFLAPIFLALSLHCWRFFGFCPQL
jgi:hypothetical protein